MMVTAFLAFPAFPAFLANRPGPKNTKKKFQAVRTISQFNKRNSEINSLILTAEENYPRSQR